jgi:ABC-type branched-subunit amino acid transport system ATPase component/ABC-type branched-subunit amino acid transport system permease subunit
MTRAIQIALLVCVGTAFVALAPDYYVTLSVYIGLSTIVCLGLVMLTGICGLTSFGQAAFVGLGAYATAMATLQFGLSPWAGLLLAISVSGLCGLLIGILTLHLSGHFLPLGTIAWSISLYLIAGNLQSIGGHTGLTAIPPLSIGSHLIDTAREFFPLVFVCVVLLAWACVNILDSRAGRALRAINGRSVMAEAMGIDTFRYKTIVFVFASLLAGLSGWLYAHFERFINPTPFSLHMSIEYLFMVVVGGLSSVGGAFAGAAILTVLHQWLGSLLPRLLGQSGQFETIVFCVITVFFLRYAPLGIWPTVARQINRLRRKTSRERALPEVESSGYLPEVNGAVSDKRPEFLVVNALRKEFGGLVAVNDVSFSVSQGEIVALIGPNGAGKSTMFNLITGVLHPTSGTITLGGERLDMLPSRVVAQLGVARTFQHVKLLDELSVLDNVCLGAHRYGRSGFLRSALRLDRRDEQQLRSRAWAAIELTGLQDVWSHPAGQLSLGQQRIVEIARALALGPQVLLLDEPAAGLRYLEKQKLADLIRKLKSSGMTILFVEHDMQFLMDLADSIVVMEYGRKIAEGTAAAVRSDARVQEAYLGVA